VALPSTVLAAGTLVYSLCAARGCGQAVAADPAALASLGALVGSSAEDLKGELRVHFEAVARAVMAGIDKATDKGPHRRVCGAGAWG
jgi:hypothetical protein